MVLGEFSRNHVTPSSDRGVKRLFKGCTISKLLVEGAMSIRRRLAKDRNNSPGSGCVRHSAAPMMNLVIQDLRLLK
jgi:hypothetical protein